MAEPTKTVTVRLRARDVEQLQARAYRLSAKVSGVARDLILTGLAGGDPQALADRLMALERRVAGLDQRTQDIHGRAQAIEQISRDLLAMFDALLQALTNERRGAGRVA